MKILDIPILIVAAGTSARLGRPKQLVNYKGMSLLSRTIYAALKSNVGPVYVVTGYKREEIAKEIPQEATEIMNPIYRNGMGSSIAIGVREIMNSECRGVIVSVGDQPHINPAIFQELQKQSQSSSGIVVSKYRKAQGPPSYFSAAYFNELIELNDDSGARSVVMKNRNKITYVDFDLGYIDLDTEEDLNLLIGPENVSESEEH